MHSLLLKLAYFCEKLATLELAGSHLECAHCTCCTCHMRGYHKYHVHGHGVLRIPHVLIPRSILYMFTARTRCVSSPAKIFFSSFSFFFLFFGCFEILWSCHSLRVSFWPAHRLAQWVCLCVCVSVSVSLCVRVISFLLEYSRSVQFCFAVLVFLSYF